MEGEEKSKITRVANKDKRVAGIPSGKQTSVSLYVGSVLEVSRRKGEMDWSRGRSLWAWK